MKSHLLCCGEEAYHGYDPVGRRFWVACRRCSRAANGHTTLGTLRHWLTTKERAASDEQARAETPRS